MFLPYRTSRFLSVSAIASERSPFAGAVPRSPNDGRESPDHTARRARGTRRLGVRVVLAALLCPAPVFAHDMWIEARPFRPATGEIVSVRLRVGQDLLGDALPLDPALVNQFVVEDVGGRRPVVRRDGADPAGLVRAATTGLLVVGYYSNPSAVELPAPKFDQYLKDEGLDAIAALRARRGDTGATVRELYSRCAKSLVLAGPPSDEPGDRRLGFVLELVAERNPYALRVGQELPVRLTYENRPLAGALVVAMNRSGPGQRLAARSDSEGRVRFQVPAGGMWLIKAVHMVPAPAGTNAEFVSFWASLTFEAGAGNPAGR
jgi:Domain of unknown function (DUF4198)